MRVRPSHRVTVAARSHNSPGEPQRNARHPEHPRPAAAETMSAEELGPEGRWFGDDCDRNGLFGSAPTQLAELREDLKPSSGEVATSDRDRPFHPRQDDGRRPPVTMETASTGKPDIYGTKVPEQVIESPVLGVDFILSVGFVHRSAGVLERLRAHGRSLVRLSQI